MSEVVHLKTHQGGYIQCDIVSHSVFFQTRYSNKQREILILNNCENPMEIIKVRLTTGRS